MAQFSKLIGLRDIMLVPAYDIFITLPLSAADSALEAVAYSPWGVLAPWGIIGITLVAIIRGQLIPSSQVERVVETYKDALERERTTTDEVASALRTLLEQNALTNDLLRALPGVTLEDPQKKPHNSSEESDEGDL